MIYTSGVISLIVQFLVGFAGSIALTLDVSPNDILLNDLLHVELIVQIIEFIFYIWLFYYFHQLSGNITPFRYLDWSITTPLMLITLSAFLHHDGTKSRLIDFLSEYSGSIVKIVLLNATMLSCGFLCELGYLDPYISTALGFIPFTFNFMYIKDTFLPSSEDTTKNAIFYWFVFFWSLYGLFALTSYTIKNTAFNILDIFSKNFFGLFLAYIVWSRSP